MATSKNKQRDGLNGRLDEMRDSGLEVTKRWMGIWEDGINYLYDNQLAGKRIKDGWDPIVANMIFPAMMQEMSLISQRNTTVITMPTDPSDAKAAALWQRHLQWLYDVPLKFGDILLNGALDGKIYGHYVAMAYWEPRHHWDWDKRKWVGMPAVSLMRPEHFAADPECDNIDKGAFAFCRRRVEREWAKAKWPDKADMIDSVVESEDPYRTAMMQPGMMALADPLGAKDKDNEQLSRIGQLATLLMGRNSGTYEYENEVDGKSRYITVEQFLFRDYSEKAAKESEKVPYEELLQTGRIRREGPLDIDSETGKPWMPAMSPDRIVREFQEPTFPYGRVVLRVNGHILNDKDEDQIWPYRRWPFILGVNHMLPHAWQGLNGVVMAAPLQDWVNISYSHLLNYMKWHGDPLTLVEEGSVVGASDNKGIAAKIKNAAGKIVVMVKGGINKIRREPPPSLGMASIQILNMMAAQLRDATGMQDIGLGKSAGSRVTATEAMRLETNTKLRQALGNKLLDGFTTRAFESLSEICQAKYSEEDWVSLIGKDGKREKGQITAEMKNAEMDIRIKAGTELPFDQERKEAKYSQVYTLLGSAATAMLPELLDAFGIDEKDAILERHGLWQQFEQFASESGPDGGGGEPQPQPQPGQLPPGGEELPPAGIGGAMPELTASQMGGAVEIQPQ
jgi:hypothetical protein